MDISEYLLVPGMGFLTIVISTKNTAFSWAAVVA
jgi:hypothetical protein